MQGETLINGGLKTRINHQFPEILGTPISFEWTHLKIVGNFPMIAYSSCNQLVNINDFRKFLWRYLNKLLFRDFPDFFKYRTDLMRSLKRDMDKYYIKAFNSVHRLNFVKTVVRFAKNRTLKLEYTDLN